MASVIETADQLYREIKKRGLHLRHKEGRDGSLLTELCAKLGCTDQQLGKCLKQRVMPASDFLRSFLQLSAPFALMFKEIWEFLGSADAPDARETIRVRFGISEPSPLELDLEAFRECVRIGEQVLAMAPVVLWTYEDLQRLFTIPHDILKATYDGSVQPSQQYRPGDPYQMLQVQSDSDPFMTMVRQVRDAFQAVADANAGEVSSLRNLPELKSDSGAVCNLPSSRSAGLLTDLLPMWNVVFAKARTFPDVSKRKAVEFFNSEIEPRLRHDSAEVEVDALAAVDILSLPFWKYRWQTYEIWATVRVLQGLKPFSPRLVINNRHCPLDGFSAGMVALLDTVDDDACVVLQMQTPFNSRGREAIKPDLSICRDRTLSAQSRAAVVEFKQRACIDRAHVEEVGSSYLAGSPCVGGVVIVNYDRAGIAPKLPPKVNFLEEVRPDRTSRVGTMCRLVLEALDSAGVKPRGSRIVALLDVSSSMGRLYESLPAQAGLKSLLNLVGVTVLRFNDGLIEGGDLPDRSRLDTVTTSGGTDLGHALQQIEQTLGVPKVLLLVSDSGYNHTDKLNSIDNFLEVEPAELSRGVTWLHGQSQKLSKPGFHAPTP